MDRKSSLSENSQVKRKRPLKKKTTHRHRQQYGDYEKERGWGETVKDKGCQIYGDRNRLDFG